MALEQYAGGTEDLANEVTLHRGNVADILTVGVYHSLNPNISPAVADFTTVQLVDGVTDPDDPLAEAGKIDILSLVGPRSGDVELAAGDWQRFTLISTAREDIIRKIDTVTIL